MSNRCRVCAVQTELSVDKYKFFKYTYICAMYLKIQTDFLKFTQTYKFMQPYNLYYPYYFKRSDADRLDDLSEQANRSSHVNEAVVYPALTWRDWKSFITQHFKALKGIAAYQHFRYINI